MYCSVSNIFSQVGTSKLIANNNQESNRNILEDQSTWTEVISERKEFSSTYITTDKRTITHYSKQPLNYYNNNGALVPVDFNPKNTNLGLKASSQPNEVTLLNNGSIEIKNKQTSLIFSANTKINGTKVITSKLDHKGLHSTMQTNIAGITKTFEFRFNGLKYNYVLNQPVTTSSKDFIIEEEIIMPEGVIIVPDHKYGREEARGWLGPILVQTKEGKEIGTMRGAICYDANNNHITAAYQYDNTGKIKIIVPNSWLSDKNRVYPITIDPLVTGPTATFTGSAIPSCISPASGSDSILVTIPAQVSVTGMFVSGSFWASPFSTAVKNDGIMYFSSGCATSATFTTTGPTGATPGTAYLSLYDLKSPLLCCIPQSCSVQTFYLSMHVSRTIGGSGCNTTYIYHDPFGGYPFSAYVEGRTVETFGPEWDINQTSVCSDDCDLTGTVFMRYGVPPFTITHPWMSGSVTAGSTPTGCNSASAIKTINLTIPNCPWTCDTISTLSIPAPTVTDACGNTISGVLADNIIIKEVPEVTALPDNITICSGETFSTTLTPCIGSSTVNWMGNSNSGSGTTLSETLTNNGTTISTTTYQVYAVNNGCPSDTIIVNVNTVPLPNAGFINNPNPIIINTPVTFLDNSTVFGGGAISWFWSFGDATFDNSQTPTHIYTVPGIYNVCLAIETTEGCIDTICEDIEVIPAVLVLPNIVTPNGDNSNDFLYFKYLEFFGSNSLKVFNRWGTLVFEKDNYKNDWTPKELSDGTYYYILTVENGESYTSFLEVMK